MKSSLLVLAAALALVAVPSAAGLGTLTVSPNPVVLGSTFTVDAGCGYTEPAISFEVVGPRKSGIDYFTAAEPLVDGCYSATWTAWWKVAGDYQITSYLRDSKGGRKKAAVVKFTVTT